MMKVLNVNASIDPVLGGGTAERTVQVSLAMARAGHKVFILTTDIGLTQRTADKLAGIELIALPCVLDRFYVPRFSLSAIKKIVAEMDIVHLMGHWTFINVLVYLVARSLGKPYVVCPAGALPIFGHSKAIKSVYNFLAGRRLIRNADACVAVASNEFAQFSAYGVPPGKVSLIPNGVNPCMGLMVSGEEFRSKHSLGKAPFILFVGRLNPIKGPDLLLRAFISIRERAGNYHLVFAGPDGGMRVGLGAVVEEYGLRDKVHFTGYLDEEAKLAAYRQSELLVIPSRQEAMSIVVLEAGIVGKPVLITDQCGFNEVQDVSGGLVVPASEEGLCSGLLVLLSDPDKRKSMGHNLKKYVESRFTWDITAGKYLELYEKVISKRQNSRSV